MTDIDKLFFNGINPSTGDYMFPGQTTNELARQIARSAGIEIDEDDDEGLDHAAELRKKNSDRINKHLGTLASDPNDLAMTGWGVVFPMVETDSPEDARQQAIMAALKPLLDLREQQAGAYYKVLYFKPSDTKPKFLARYHAGPGPSDPEKVPYYLMLVGSPTEIPFSAQYQLDVQYAVGRIHFETIDDYAAYANSVVAAETQGLALAREVATFAVANEDDPATQLSAAHLVTPLFDKLAPLHPDWKIRRIDPANATKANLASLLGGGDATPAVVFTASHGAGFLKGDPRQRSQQGAIVCGDWPGPAKWARKPMPDDFLFAGADLPSTANPHGAIVFNFACYGAGTPLYNDYGQRTNATEREAITDAPFVSALHQRLLSLPRGGALAAIGHVERAWGCSFMWAGTAARGGTPSQLAVFEKAMKEILKGSRIGAAFETFNERYAELSSDLTVELENISFKKKYDTLALADMWTANNDARGYAITGDPAVRVPVAPAGGATRRVEVQRIELHSQTVARDPAPPAEPASTTTQAAAPATEGSKGDDYNFSIDAGQAFSEAELTRVFGGDRALTMRTIVTADPAGDPSDAPQLVSRVEFGGSVTTHLTPDAPAGLQKLHDDILARALDYRTALLRALAAARPKR